MAISTNGGSNPTQVIYNGKNCTEVRYKSSPSAEAVQVWPEKKYYLKYLWYPSDGQPKFSTLCIQTWPLAKDAGGGTIYAKKNDVDPRWWEMLFWYPNPVQLKSATLDKLSGIQFYQWADDNVTDKTAAERYDMLDSRYTDPDNPLLIACWFKKDGEAVSDLPPLPGQPAPPEPIPTTWTSDIDGNNLTYRTKTVTSPVVTYWYWWSYKIVTIDSHGQESQIYPLSWGFTYKDGDYANTNFPNSIYTFSSDKTYKLKIFVGASSSNGVAMPTQQFDTVEIYTPQHWYFPYIKKTHVFDGEYIDLPITPDVNDISISAERIDNTSNVKLIIRLRHIVY